MTTTDRRDATDAQFADELARLNRLDVADVAADVREEAVASAIREVWETQDELRPPWIDLSRAAIAAIGSPQFAELADDLEKPDPWMQGDDYGEGYVDGKNLAARRIRAALAGEGVT